VRPAERAAALLRAAAAAAASASPASPPPRLDFPRVREAFRELRNSGARRPRLVAALAGHPGCLALPASELRARLRALQTDGGLEEFYQLPRTLEKHLAVLGQPAGAACELRDALRDVLLLPPSALGGLLFSAPALLSTFGPGSAPGWRALADELGLSCGELGAAAAVHPLLLLPPLGGSVADRAALWRAQLGGGEAGAAGVRRLAAAAPAALTASCSVLRRKLHFFRNALDMDAARAADAAPAAFGEVSLERSLAPRAAFLLGPLRVPRAAAAAAAADWSAAASAAAFLAVAARLAAADVPAEALSEDAFRAFAAAAAGGAGAAGGGADWEEFPHSSQGGEREFAGV